MSMTAASLRPANSLRVFVSTRDAAELLTLQDILARAGHHIVMSADNADILLSAVIGTSGDRCLAMSMGENQAGGALLPSDASPSQIDAALHAVATGLIVRSPITTEIGFRALEDDDGQKLLTPREIEVLKAIGEGWTNKAIARQLGISLHTVKFHTESIFRKLGVSTRTGAIRKASEWRKSQSKQL